MAISGSRAVKKEVIVYNDCWSVQERLISIIGPTMLHEFLWFLQGNRIGLVTKCSAFRGVNLNGVVATLSSCLTKREIRWGHSQEQYAGVHSKLLTFAFIRVIGIERE